MSTREENVREMMREAARLERNRKRREARAKAAPKSYRLTWSPEGRVIGTVSAHSASEAKRKAPLPYRKYRGEIYAEEV